jgi:hypothetical protein
MAKQKKIVKIVWAILSIMIIISMVIWSVGMAFM